MLSHILTLPMCLMTCLQVCGVGLAVDYEALMAHLCVLTRVILPIGPLREFEKD